MRKVISITGSNGFIGSNLKKYFLSLGYHINCLVRKIPEYLEQDVTYVLYHLEKPIYEAIFPEADIVFHCAFMAYSKTSKRANEINISGAQNLIRICRDKNMKIVFFSSLSAHNESGSNYGRNKLFLEGLFDPTRDLVLKLGLVMGDGGIFASMEQIIRKSKILPLIDNGRQPVHIVAVEDLMTICKISFENNIVGKFNIGKVLPITLKAVYLLIGKKNNVKNYFLPVSSILILTLLKITEQIGLVLPIGTENILGLKHSKVWDTSIGMSSFKNHSDSELLSEYMETGA